MSTSTHPTPQGPAGRLPGNVLTVATVAAMLAAYGAFSWLCPLMVDDFNFMVEYRAANCGSSAPSVGGVLAYVGEVWRDENGRLANMLCAPVALWVPKWLWALALGATMAALHVLAARMARGSWRIGALLPAVWVACILLLPWRDESSLIPLDFALNYLVSALLMLLTLWSAHRLEASAARALPYALMLTAGLLTGMVHEGASLPLLAALTLVAARRRAAMPRQWWGLYAALAAGALLLISSPGLCDRVVDSAHRHASTPLLHYLHAFVRTTPLFAAAVAAAAVAAACRRGREAMKRIASDRLNAYLLIAAAAGAAMTIVLTAPKRAAIWSSLLLIVLLFRIGVPWLAPRLRPRAVAAAAATMLAAACLFYAGVLHWQKRICDEYTAIMAELMAVGTEGFIYKDTIRFTPWWTLGHPTAGVWCRYAQAVHVNRLLGRANDASLVVPAALRDYDFAHPTPVASNRDCYQAGDMLLLKESDLEWGLTLHNWRITLADGTVAGVYLNMIPHTVDGHAWIVGIPTRSHVRGPYRSAVNVDP